MTVFVHSTVQLTVKSTKKEDNIVNRDCCQKKINSKLNRQQDGGKIRQTFCDNCDMILKKKLENITFLLKESFVAVNLNAVMLKLVCILLAFIPHPNYPY